MSPSFGNASGAAVATLFSIDIALNLSRPVSGRIAIAHAPDAEIGHGQGEARLHRGRNKKEIPYCETGPSNAASEAVRPRSSQE